LAKAHIKFLLKFSGKSEQKKIAVKLERPIRSTAQIGKNKNGTTI
jgi:hypothetical protein